MPTLPEIDNQSVLPSASGQPYLTIHPISGGQDFGKEVAAFGEHQLDIHNETVVNDTYSNQFAPAARDLVSHYMQLEGKDALNAHQDTVDQLETLRTNFRDNLENPVQRRLFDNDSRNRAQFLLQQIYAHRDEEQKHYELQTHLDTLKNITTDADGAVNDHDQWMLHKESGELQIAKYNQDHGIPIDSEITKQQVHQFDRDLYANRIYAISATDPVAAKQQLQEDADKIDPKETAVLQNHLDALINRNQAHGQKVYDQISTQISQLVPLTQEGWDRASTKLTPDQIDELKGHEQAAQALSRLPVQQMQDEVRKNDAELLQHGATDEKEIRRNAILHSAINKVVTQVDKDPFAYSHDRLGLDPGVIQLQWLQNPALHDQLVDQFQKRSATLNSVQKASGVRPSNRGLLTPDEATNFANVLNQIRPQGQQDLMTRLAGVIKDRDDFQNTVQQIFPGNKPLAFAALLGLKPDEKVTVPHGNFVTEYVSSDTITAKQAAQYIYEGQKLLNPPKSDKTEEGPKSEFKLPPEQPSGDFEKGMAQYFADASGNAFQGHPTIEAEAYQTYKAMYAGMAAAAGDRGDFGTSNEQAVKDRMQNAAVATLGVKLPKRGGLDTLAPWGMNDAQVNDIMEKKLGNIPGTEPGLQSKWLQQWHDGTIGLMEVGYDKYWMVHNGQPVLDPAGKEVEIDFGKPDAPAAKPASGVLGDSVNAPKVSATESPQMSSDEIRSYANRSGADLKNIRYDHETLNDYAEAKSREAGIPPRIINALKNAGEKSRNSRVVSEAGARGIMQFIPKTWQQYGKGDIENPFDSIDASVAYVKDLLARHNGNVRAAMAEYHGGNAEGDRVASGKLPSGPKTRAYLERAFKYFNESAEAGQ